MVHLNQKGVNILALVPCWLEVLLSFYKTGTNAKILKSNVIGMSTWTYLSLDFFLKNVCYYILLVFQPKLLLNSATAIRSQPIFRSASLLRTQLCQDT